MTNNINKRMCAMADELRDIKEQRKRLMKRMENWCKRHATEGTYWMMDGMVYQLTRTIRLNMGFNEGDGEIWYPRAKMYAKNLWTGSESWYDTNLCYCYPITEAQARERLALFERVLSTAKYNVGERVAYRRGRRIYTSIITEKDVMINKFGNVQVCYRAFDNYTQLDEYDIVKKQYDNVAKKLCDDALVKAKFKVGDTAYSSVDADEYTIEGITPYGLICDGEGNHNIGLAYKVKDVSTGKERNIWEGALRHTQLKEREEERRVIRVKKYHWE